MSYRFSKCLKKFEESVSNWNEQFELFKQELPPIKSFFAADLPLSQTFLKAISEKAQNSINPLAKLNEAVEKLLLHRKEKQRTDFLEIISECEKREVLQNLERKMKEESSRLENLFGKRFDGFGTTWDEVLKALDWTSQMQNLFTNENYPMSERFTALCTLPGEQTPQVAGLAEEFTTAEESFNDLKNLFEQPAPFFGGKNLNDCSFAEIEEAVKNMREKLHDLRLWGDLKKTVR